MVGEGGEGKKERKKDKLCALSKLLTWYRCCKISCVVCSCALPHQKKKEWGKKEKAYVLRNWKEWREAIQKWMCLCADFSWWPCVSSGVGLQDVQKSLPTATILWSYNSQCKDAYRSLDFSIQIPQPLINLGTESRYLPEKGKLYISQNGRGWKEPPETI